MTVDEIKQNYSMYDILTKYNIPFSTIKKNVSCPLHGKDKNPSMQIFKDGFNCHTCGKHGDIFVFVQEIEHCSFKDAFLLLGGTYENSKDDFFTQQKLERLKLEREKRLQAKIRQQRLRYDTSRLIEYYMAILRQSEPLSDIWCECQNNLFYLLYAWEEKYIKENEVDISGIISRRSKPEFIRNIVG